jgi:hypothetical protein
VRRSPRLHPDKRIISELVGTSWGANKRTIAGPDVGFSWRFWAGVAKADVVAAPLSLRELACSFFRKKDGAVQAATIVTMPTTMTSRFFKTAATNSPRTSPYDG